MFTAYLPPYLTKLGNGTGSFKQLWMSWSMTVVVENMQVIHDN